MRNWADEVLRSCRSVGETSETRLPTAILTSYTPRCEPELARFASFSREGHTVKLIKCLQGLYEHRQ
jgi:hypothetical protein